MLAHQDKKLATQDLDTLEASPYETFRFTVQDLARNHLHSGDNQPPLDWEHRNSELSVQGHTQPSAVLLTQYPLHTLLML